MAAISNISVASGLAAQQAALGVTTGSAAGFTPANPAATTSASLLMAGLGLTCTFTPVLSGLTLVTVAGYVQIATAAAAITVGARYGTGSAPANGAAVTGTRFGAVADYTVTPAAAATAVQFVVTALLKLTAGTAYWFDVAASSAANAVSFTNVGVTMTEE